MRIAVVGAGSWGTTVAALAARRNPVVLWSRRSDLAETINRDSENRDYLPSFRLPYGLRATSNLDDAVGGADVIIMGVPSHGYREVLETMKPHIGSETPIISLTKGIEQGTLMRMTQVGHDVLPHHSESLFGVLTGPNLAAEIMAGHPAATVIAIGDESIARDLQQTFMDATFRVYTNPDLVGCEIAGALKNVMAIAAGMVAGLGFGDNTRAALVTRALAELTRLGVAMGGERSTFAGLAGMGDLIATCVSDKSRNHRVGVELAKGLTLDQIVEQMNMVAEGVKTTGVVLELARQHEVETPIAEQVGRVLYEGEHPREAVLNLMTRQAKDELKRG